MVRCTCPSSLEHGLKRGSWGRARPSPIQLSLHGPSFAGGCVASSGGYPQIMLADGVVLGGGLVGLLILILIILAIIYLVRRM